MTQPRGEQFKEEFTAAGAQEMVQKYHLRLCQGLGTSQVCREYSPVLRVPGRI